MYLKKLQDCPEFIARDNSVLREMLHPDKADLQLRYSLAHAIVAPGMDTLPHSLRTSEVYYIIEGKGIMNISDEECEVGMGDTIYIPPFAVQHIKNTGTTDLIFIQKIHSRPNLMKLLSLSKSFFPIVVVSKFTIIPTR